MTIGYLTSGSLQQLKNLGASTCLYDTSTTYEHFGCLTTVYFFNVQGEEVAHQTGISGECGYPELTFYRRKWGESNKTAYEKSGTFEQLLALELAENTVYRII